MRIVGYNRFMNVGKVARKTEFVVPISGEVVEATDRVEAIQKMARLRYTPEELEAIMTIEEYVAGSFVNYCC
jgi:hypothetical protein